MQLYNTLTAHKEPFEIPTERPVTVYVCGVTPYDTTHVGHARTYLTFDILIRYLKWRGAQVHYVQNVTDVDDPLFERARRDGVDWRKLAEEQTAQYVADTAALNITAPDHFPRASAEIAGMINIIERLVELGHAYVRAGNVYFSVNSDPHFGALAQLGRAEMLELANQRGNNPDDPHKDDPLDFVLWQRGNPDDPTWDSPFGPGRPGWHIECSAMATRYLGPQIDIHGGGSDLIFPHHACEIAQTEPYTDLRPFVRFWMHTGLVWLDGAKMSKSLGNLVFVRDALETHSANILRWYLLSHHYREDFHYERAAVSDIAAQVVMFERTLQLEGGTGTVLDLANVRIAFDAALGDDLDTARTQEILLAAARQIQQAAAAGQQVAAAQATLAELLQTFGLQLS